MINTLENMTDEQAFTNVTGTGQDGAVVLAINHPTKRDGDEPVFLIRRATGAKEAINFVKENLEGVKVWDGGPVDKFAILGYNMLKAGLTVQTVIEKDEKRYFYCPGYVALATNDQTPLDAQLQIAGRSFVDMKDLAVPDDWKIQMLAVKDAVPRLQSYSRMEKKLASVGKKEEATEESTERPINTRGKKLYELLRDSFNVDMMLESGLESLGKIGTRRGEFGNVLGLDKQEAIRRGKAAARLRKHIAKAPTQLNEQDKNSVLENVVQQYRLDQEIKEVEEKINNDATDENNRRILNDLNAKKQKLETITTENDNRLVVELQKAMMNEVPEEDDDENMMKGDLNLDSQPDDTVTVGMKTDPN
jgi:hypothetical protein